MNSLTYLSNQFDAYASPTTPPSTPTSDYGRKTSHSRRKSNADPSELKRTKSWSNKPFLFPSHYPPSPPKRSFSSPADFIAITSLRRSATPSSLDAESPSVHMQSVIRRIFFIRVFMLLWRLLCEAWASITRRDAAKAKQAVMVHVVPDSDNDDSGVDKPRIQQEQGPPLPPSPSLLPTPTEPYVTRSHTDPTPPPEAKPDSQSLPHSASLSAQVGTSRSSTPVLSARKTPFHLPKTLVLDLDETLIHSTSRPVYSSGSGGGLLGLNTFGRRNKGAGHVVDVVLGGRSTLYHVYKRPFVDFFLRTVSGWYTLVIFTASMEEYADPVIDWLDAGRGILARRFFRDSCTQLPNGSYTKDLSIVEQDLSRVCLVDNSPISYRVNEANGIPIEGWTHDPSDQALLDLLPVLDSLRFTSDVRRVLGIRGFS